jgi:hypothetical protein
MTVEPYLLHAIWEVDTDTLKGIKDQFGDELDPVKFMLRLYDVAGISLEGGNAQASFDRDIDLSDKKCYVSLREAGKAYVAEIGYKKRSGNFCSLARSNVTETPRVRPVPATGRHLIPAFEAAEKADTVIVEPLRPLSPELAIPEKKHAPEICGISKNEKEKGKEKAQPHLRGGACTISAMDVLRQGRRALPPERGTESPFPPRILATQVIQKMHKKESAFDLTEISERKFTVGISSKLNNKDSHSLQVAE